MSEVVIGNKGSGKAPRKTYKQKKAARQEFFSLKAYLYKKAQLRAIKLQFREARRAAKKNGDILLFADWKASLEQAYAKDHAHTHEHGHDHDHNHDHEELEVSE